MAGENELNDVSLCFQALGIEFGAPPDEVEKAYKRMIDVIKKKQSSANPAERAEAAKDLELAHDLYDKIKNSVTYNTRLKERDQAESLKEQIKKSAEQQQQMQFKVCLSCQKTIGASLKKCPYCKEPVRTPLEMFFHRLFSGANLVIILVLLVLAVGGIGYYFYQEMQTKPVETPPAASTFSNSSGLGSFANQTGAANKP